MNHVKFSLSLLLSLSVSAVCAMEAPKANDTYVAQKSEAAPIKALAWAKNAPGTWVPTELDQISTHAKTQEHPLALMPTLSLQAGYEAKQMAVARTAAEEKALAARKKAELVELEACKLELMRRHTAKFAELDGNNIQVSKNEKAIQDKEVQRIREEEQRKRDIERLQNDITTRTQDSLKLLKQYEDLGALIASNHAEIAAATPQEEKPATEIKKAGWSITGFFKRG